MYTVYILQSLKVSRFYIGHTRNLDNRLSRHNRGLVKSTKGYSPWELVYKEEFNNKSDAYNREMEIKSYKGGNALKKLIRMGSRAVKGDRL